MSLNDIFCQDKAISLLQRALGSGRVPHAYIFAGPEGVGKFKTAGEWARLLLCKEPVVREDETGRFADSCGSCQSCRLFDAGSHPDFNHVYKELREFTRDGKGKPPPVDLPIDVIREFLIEKVFTRPTLSDRKVFVVSEAERLNAASQNCLLKVLEEPPDCCSIILLCTRLDRLLATTRSRCQIIRFGPVDEDRIVERLMEMGLEQRRARYFARLAQGGLGPACQWAELELADGSLYQIKSQVIESIAGCGFADSLELAGQFLERSREIALVWNGLHMDISKTDINRKAHKTIVRIAVSALRDAMTANVTPQKQLVNFDQTEQIEKLAGRFGPEQCADRIADCYTTLRWIEASVNEKLIFEQMLLNLSGSDKMRV
jgi:DNA polymerase-3 subunit delta'